MLGRSIKSIKYCKTFEQIIKFLYMNRALIFNQVPHCKVVQFKSSATSTKKTDWPGDLTYAF